MPIADKKVVGDASETGVVKFVQTLKDIEDTRTKYPVFSYIENTTNQMIDCAIPFSSEIKFNLYVRDMTADKKKISAYENEISDQPAFGDLTVIMKGAPERILSRCSRILF